MTESEQERQRQACLRELQELLNREGSGLRLWSTILIGYLLLLVLVCVVLVAVALLPDISPLKVPDAARPLASAILAGTMGSAISALFSLLDRRAAGWEFDNGRKWPPPADPCDMNDKRAMFVVRMVPWFAVRPWFGAALGLVFYLGFSGGYLTTTRSASLSDASAISAIAFLAFLVGLMAKTFIERLRDAFEALFGARAKQQPGRDAQAQERSPQESAATARR